MLHYQLSALFSLHSNEARKFQYKSHSIVYSMNENNETTYYLVRISILFILCKNKGTISNNLVGGGKKAVFIFFIFIELFSLFYKTLILYFFFSSFFLCQLFYVNVFFLQNFDDQYESKNCKILFAFKSTSHEI